MRWLVSTKLRFREEDHVNETVLNVNAKFSEIYLYFT